MAARRSCGCSRMVRESSIAAGDSRATVVGTIASTNKGRKEIDCLCRASRTCEDHVNIIDRPRYVMIDEGTSGLMRLAQFGELFPDLAARDMVFLSVGSPRKPVPIKSYG